MQAIWQTIPIAHIVKIELRKRRENLWLQKSQDISVSHRVANNSTNTTVLNVQISMITVRLEYKTASPK